MCSAKHIKCVGIVGCGVIGMSWAMFYLSKGLNVVAMDPDSAAEQNLHAYLRGARKAFDDNHMPLPLELEHLTFTTQIDEHFKKVDFIQENGPERVDIKQQLITQLEQQIADDVIIASSSSGLQVSDFQQKAAHPERIILGHPFNPPHLIPLVEVCGGKLTSRTFIDTAMDFYKALGKQPILLNKEITGHIANRLQGALIREVLYLLQENVASAADLDKALAHGPGLRWALMGQFLTSDLGGGKGGLQHFLEHLGGPIESWWADLGTLEKITPELIQLATQGVKEEFQQSDIQPEALQQARDRALVKLINDKQHDPVINRF